MTQEEGPMKYVPQGFYKTVYKTSTVLTSDISTCIALLLIDQNTASLFHIHPAQIQCSDSWKAPIVELLSCSVESINVFCSSKVRDNYVQAAHKKFFSFINNNKLKIKPKITNKKDSGVFVFGWLDNSVCIKDRNAFTPKFWMESGSGSCPNYLYCSSWFCVSNLLVEHTKDKTKLPALQNLDLKSCPIFTIACLDELSEVAKGNASFERHLKYYRDHHYNNRNHNVAIACTNGATIDIRGLTTDGAVDLIHSNATIQGSQIPEIYSKSSSVKASEVNVGTFIVEDPLSENVDTNNAILRGRRKKFKDIGKSKCEAFGDNILKCHLVHQQKTVLTTYDHCAVVLEKKDHAIMFDIVDMAITQGDPTSKKWNLMYFEYKEQPFDPSKFAQFLLENFSQFGKSIVISTYSVIKSKIDLNSYLDTLGGKKVDYDVCFRLE